MATTLELLKATNPTVKGLLSGKMVMCSKVTLRKVKNEEKERRVMPMDLGSKEITSTTCRMVKACTSGLMENSILEIG